jgi:hypothetical protein
MGKNNSMLDFMEGIIPEFDREDVVRSPSSSSVTGIVPTGAYPCAPLPPRMRGQSM